MSEEYNSNVYLTQTDEKNDYITTIIPAINALYHASLWDWDLRYAFIERHYAQTLPQPDRTFQLGLVNMTRIVDERVGIRLNDEYARISLTPTRDFALESAFLNQTDQNIFTFNPFAAARPLSQTTVSVGYSYQNTWYKDPTAIDTAEHIGSLVIRGDMTASLVLSAGYRHIQNLNRVQEFVRDEFQGRVRYEYADRSFVTMGYGRVRFDLELPDGHWQDIGEAVLSHRSGAATTTLEAGKQFIPDPLRILRREDRLVGSVDLEIDRTTVQVTVAGRNYYDILLGNRVNASTMGTVRIGYSITQQVGVLLNGTRELIKSYALPPTNVLVMIKGLRLHARSSEHVTTGLECRFTTTEAHDNVSTSYRSEIIMADIRYQF